MRISSWRAASSDSELYTNHEPVQNMTGSFKVPIGSEFNDVYILIHRELLWLALARDSVAAPAP